MTDVISRGRRISYLMAGDGEPLVVIPGHLQAAQDWVDAGYFDLLGDRFRVVVIDPLGYGDSDKPHDPAEYTLTARAEHLDAVLGAEGIDAAHLWGYSLGAMIAEAFARQRPARTRALVLGGTLPGLTGADRRNLFESQLDLYQSRDWERLSSEVFPFLSDETRELFGTRNDLVACGVSLEGSFEPLATETDPMPLPMLCYVGTSEWFWEGSREVTEAAGGRFFPVEGADHADAFTRADEVAAEVRTFLLA